jgi:hypothetical protein
MAQPPDFGYDQLKKMIRVRNFRIANHQSKNDKLKGDIEECQAKMRKLQQQLMNGDIHQGRNTLRTSDYD